MKARTVSRELALFALFQMDKKGDKFALNRLNLQELIINTVRSLSTLAEEQIESVGSEIASFRDYLIDYEIDHPENLELPIDIPTRPVALATTKDMMNRLEKLLQSIDNLQEALDVPEIKALAEREDIQNYAMMLVRNVSTHQAEIDQLIGGAAEGWKVERIQKMDLMLMRLALAEIKYAENVDTATVINEILELAKRFTTEESRKFIHGILGNITGEPVGAGEHV